MRGSEILPFCWLNSYLLGEATEKKEGSHMKWAVILLALALILTGCGRQNEGAATDFRQQRQQLLTPEQAKQIALEQAALTREQVVNLQASLEYEDGVPEYEVEFRQGNWRYDCKIHGHTGRIISFEVEARNRQNIDSVDFLPEE